MSTAIEWTDETWNPVVGCDRISPGCAHCYAKTLHDKRHVAALAGKRIAVQYLQPFETIQLKPERLTEPLTWRAPRRVFVNSVSDLFHESVPAEFILRVFDVMERAQRHTFQILTKRPERMLDVLAGANGAGLEAPPLPNVWLGVSVETQRFADERIPLLLQAPAAVRFISAEPLLGPIDLEAAGGLPIPTVGGVELETWLDWVIVGGESGAGARPCALEWIRQVVAQCQAAGVPAFVKQLGSHPFVNASAPIYGFTDAKAGNPAEWPADLRVRQWPAE